MSGGVSYFEVLLDEALFSESSSPEKGVSREASSIEVELMTDGSRFIGGS